MSKPAFVYICADPYRNLTLEVTKDLDVAALRLEEEMGRPVKVVHKEEFPTIREAFVRLKALKRLSKTRRARLVTRQNPNWQDLVAPRPVFANPSSGSSDPPAADGGVCASVPRSPVGPRAASDAGPWPHSESP